MGNDLPMIKAIVSRSGTGSAMCAITLLLVSVGSAAPAANEAKPQAMAPAEDVWTLPRDGELRCISPDGRWLVYAGLFAEPRESRDHVVDLTSGKERPLAEMLPTVEGATDCTGVAFCPMRPQLLLVRRTRTLNSDKLAPAGRSTFFAVVDVATGKGKNVLPSGEGMSWSAAWVGEKLVASRAIFSEGTVTPLQLVNPVTAEGKPLPVTGFLWDAGKDAVLFQGDVEAPAKPFVWKELAERRTYGLLVADQAGRVRRTIRFSTCGTPSLSPDGRCVAVALRFTDEPERNGFYLFPADPEKPGRRINGIDGYFGVWALDDGRALVHMGVKKDEKPGGSWDLLLANPDDTLATLVKDVQKVAVVGQHVYFQPRGERAVCRLAIPPVK